MWYVQKNNRNYAAWESHILSGEFSTFQPKLALITIGEISESKNEHECLVSIRALTFTLPTLIATSCCCEKRALLQIDAYALVDFEQYPFSFCLYTVTKDLWTIRWSIKGTSFKRFLHTCHLSHPYGSSDTYRSVLEGTKRATDYHNLRTLTPLGDS